VGWVLGPDELYRFAGPQPSWPFDVAQLSAPESRPGHTAWVLDDGGLPLAQFELTVTDASAWLSRVIIDPAQRGRGLARTLLDLAIERCRDRGATSVGLNVIVGNTPAIRSYLAAGFHVVDGASRPDVLAMRLPLAPR
jgi:GNAT superfamily N-acetyltransferase